MSVRKITVKSGNEEFTMNVTEEEYRNYYRPWWQQKKHEQRNREGAHVKGSHPLILHGAEPSFDLCLCCGCIGLAVLTQEYGSGGKRNNAALQSFTRRN